MKEEKGVLACTLQHFGRRVLTHVQQALVCHVARNRVAFKGATEGRRTELDLSTGYTMMSSRRSHNGGGGKGGRETPSCCRSSAHTVVLATDETRLGERRAQSGYWMRLLLLCSKDWPTLRAAYQINPHTPPVVIVTVPSGDGWW